MTAEREGGGTTQVTGNSQVARIFAWRRGFNSMHLIDLGVRLGLFKAFAEARQPEFQFPLQTGLEELM